MCRGSRVLTDGELYRILTQVEAHLRDTDRPYPAEFVQLALKALACEGAHRDPRGQEALDSGTGLH